MAPRRPLTERMTELIGQRVPFVHATVVRAQCPTSAHPGDRAIVLRDGTMEGFVGGQCAEESVRVHATRALETGEALLLRVLPGGEDEFPETPGALTVVNPCLSGGALEIFLEPRLPPPLLCVVGETPIADAVVTLAEPLGFAVQQLPPGAAPQPGAIAAVVSTHGRDETEAIRAALDNGVGFVGLVASHKRGEAVLDSLELTPDEARRVHTPVGLDIGAVTADEIALSILADIVRAIRVEGLAPGGDADATPAPSEAIDPVCGMTVIIRPDTPHLRVGGEDHWFCNPHCRETFAATLEHAP